MIPFVLGVIVGVCGAVLGLALRRAATRGDRDTEAAMSSENGQNPAQMPSGSFAESQMGDEATLPRGTVCPGIERDCEGGEGPLPTHVWIELIAPGRRVGTRRQAAESLARRWWKLMGLRNPWPECWTTWDEEQALGTPACEDLIESMEMFLLGRPWEPLRPAKKYQDMKNPAEAGEGEG